MPNETTMNSTTTASVNEGLVELFDYAGDSIFVPESAAENWISKKGFRRTKFDIEGTASELISFLEAAVPAVSDYVSGVVEDGVIDPSDEANYFTAVKAMSKVFDLWNQLQADISRKYAVVNAAGVAMLSPEGEEATVDPNQVNDFKAKGWKEVA